MENSSVPLNEESASSSSEPSQIDRVDALAGSNFKEAAMQYADIKESERLNLATEDEESANDSNEVSDRDSDDASRQPEQKGELSPGIKKRIDGLQGRLAKEREAHKAIVAENTFLKEKVRLYDEEVNRLAKRAQLDPLEEEARYKEITAAMESLDSRLDNEVSERFSQQDAKEAREEQLSEMRSKIFEVANEYSGVFSGRELAMYMQQSGNHNPETAAQALSDARILAVQSRTKEPLAPMTASGKVSGNREPAMPWRWRGAASVEEFIDQEERVRKGR